MLRLESSILQSDAPRPCMSVSGSSGGAHKYELELQLRLVRDVRTDPHGQNRGCVMKGTGVCQMMSAVVRHDLEAISAELQSSHRGLPCDR